MKKVIRVALVVVAVYLAIGLVFSIGVVMPPRSWTCPDPSIPGNVRYYYDASEVPSDDCLPTMSAAERAEGVAFFTAAWLPVVVLKSMDDD